jgi:hypothetical protein
LVALEGAMFAGAVAILGTFAKDLPPDSSRQDLVRLFLWALLALCFIGLTTSIVWIFMVRRGAYIGHVIERQMVDIEEFFRSKYDAVAVLRPYTRWAEALRFKHGRRFAAYQRRYLLGGIRLSYSWTFVVVLFCLVWVFLIVRVSGLFPSKPAVVQDGNGPVPITDHVLMRDFVTLVQFSPFAVGTAQRNCGIDRNDQQAIANALRAIRSVKDNGLSPLVILIGGTDRVPLSARYRKQYESNSGLGQARAATIKQCLTNVIDDALRESVRFVTLDAGPGYTPSEHQESSADEQERANDRTVRALVMGVAAP